MSKCFRNLLGVVLVSVVVSTSAMQEKKLIIPEAMSSKDLFEQLRQKKAKEQSDIKNEPVVVGINSFVIEENYFSLDGHVKKQIKEPETILDVTNVASPVAQDAVSLLDITRVVEKNTEVIMSHEQVVHNLTPTSLIPSPILSVNGVQDPVVDNALSAKNNIVDTAEQGKLSALPEAILTIEEKDKVEHQEYKVNSSEIPATIVEGVKKSAAILLVNNEQVRQGPAQPNVRAQQTIYVREDLTLCERIDRAVDIIFEPADRLLNWLGGLLVIRSSQQK